jgi:2-iminoacetate synthase
MDNSSFIDLAAIEKILADSREPSTARLSEILAKSRELKGLSLEEVAELLAIASPVALEELFEVARFVKNEIYGERVVLFAPLYISNLCSNDCAYCAFRTSNRQLKRRVLSQDEIKREIEVLVDEGHKRIVLLAGEAYPDEGLDYVFKAIDSVYEVSRGKSGCIRRVNVNLAPLTIDEFRELKKHKIGTYQIFQETYHLPTYKNMHRGGPKMDFAWRLNAPSRAMEAGIDDVGIGPLLGLYDYRFEVLGTMAHIRHLESRFGVGPHTISVPRVEPACGSDIAANPPWRLDDTSFKKLVAIFRLAVPYTGIIMSTRETPELRRQTLALGVSQISASSRVNPGGYADRDRDFDESQFSVCDDRTLDEVIADLARMGYIPSFCTGCYRVGRTGDHFMELARPGEIKHMCGPNGMATFLEYLLDYASPSTRQAGESLLAGKLEELKTADLRAAELTAKMLDKIRSGQRDVYI